jgi:hypothetical protein
LPHQSAQARPGRARARLAVVIVSSQRGRGGRLEWRITPSAFALRATADKSAPIRPSPDPGYSLPFERRD